MESRPHWKNIIVPGRIVLLLAAILGLTSAISWYSASYYMGEFLPLGGDSFYHAVRILALQDSGQLIQFDRWMHAPEGSMITWPWGYDTIAGAYLWLVKLITGDRYAEMGLLLSFPPLLFLLSLYIVHLLLRQLGLNSVNYALAIISYSLSPLVQGLYGFGRLDHHGAEQIAFLATILLGLKWIKNKDAVFPSIWLGLILGGTMALHTSLFLLQLPIALYLFISWLRHETPGNITIVGATTFITTLILALPSMATRQFLFEFSTFSWFHVYVSAGFMLFCLYLSRAHFSIANLLILTSLLLLYAIPVYAQSPAYDYLSGTLYNFSDLMETRSPLRGAQLLGIDSLIKWYSGTIYLIPFVFLWSVWALFRTRTAPLLLSVFSVFGILMAAAQFRFYVFAIFSLTVVIFYLLNKHLSIKKQHQWIYFIFVLISTQAWPIVQLTQTPAIANDRDFRIMYPAFKSMKYLCINGNKTILAASNDGHYIRYFSKCKTISNTFLLTRQHEKKARLVDEMFTLSLNELSERYPWIDYIFVRVYPTDIQQYPKMLKLKSDVLFSKPERFSIISESTIFISINERRFPAYRLIRINR